MTKKSFTNNWKPVTIGGMTGILVGTGAAMAYQSMASDSKSDEVVGNTPKPAASNDDMSFPEAFNAARAELGSGKTFEWHGKTYSINLRETRDIVERVEQEMRINLVLQPGQLGLGILCLFVFQLLTNLTDTHEMPDANGHGHHDDVEQEEHECTREESYPCPAMHGGHMLPNHEVAIDETVVHGQDKQQVADEEKPVAATEEQERPKQVEIGEIDYQRSTQLLPHHDERRECCIPIAGADKCGQREHQHHKRPDTSLSQEQQPIFFSDFLHCLQKYIIFLILANFYFKIRCWVLGDGC